MSYSTKLKICTALSACLVYALCLAARASDANQATVGVSNVVVSVQDINSTEAVLPAADANSAKASLSADANVATASVPTDANAVKASSPVDANAAPASSTTAASEPNSASGQASNENESGADGAIQSLIFKKDMSIRDGLRFLAAKYHKNIIPSTKVDGPIGVNALYDVTFEEALQAILGNNFYYDVDGNFIRVYTEDEYKKVKSNIARMQHKVFTLHYITAIEASKMILPLKSEAGAISTTTPAEKGISGGTGGGEGGGGGGGSSSGGGDSTAINDTIVMQDFPENIARAQEVIAGLDTRPKQVLVEATILSALLTDEMKFGVDLSIVGGSSVTADTIGFFTEGGPGLKVGVAAGDVEFFISALDAVTDTTILANPKILAVNKQEGSMLVGKNLGYRDSTTIGQGGVATEGEVKFLKTGTQLVFRPYIGQDGYIRMEVYPKDSTASLNSDGVPTETTTELKSNIMVKEGETIVIGGLFRDVVESTRNQVPVLGDIPFLGVFFRGTTEKTTRQEVIVLLTPHIIDAADQTGGKDRLDDASRKMWGAGQGLQWINRTRISDEHYAKAVELYSKGQSCAALSQVQSALELNPTYLEALRLRDRIVREANIDDSKVTARIMLDNIDRQEAPLWIRD